GKPTNFFLAFKYHGGRLSAHQCLGTSCSEQLFGGQYVVSSTHGAALCSTFPGPGSGLCGGAHVLATGVGVHQTALYDFISTILLFLFLTLVMNRRVWREGVMICTWAVWYLTVRVGTDFVRVDKRFFGLTGSQWSAAIFAAVAAIALIRWGVQAKRGTGKRPPALVAGGSSTTAFTPPSDPSA